MDECEKELREGPVVPWLFAWEEESLDRLVYTFEKVYPNCPQLWDESLSHYFEVKRPKNA